MSSSGLIYAGIVGAWAVYLVPVWLRREEQLNEARQKARYAAAIRTLGRTEQFEKRWRAEETLAATGTDGPWRPPPETKPETKQPAKKSSPPATAKPAERRPVAGTAGSTVAAARRTKPSVVSSRVPQQPTTAVASTPQKKTQTQRNAVRRRGVLLMRRRRAVALLFTLATVGAMVSATLGIAYIWAMLAPAALFSVYIVNIRRDERARAEERYRRRQAALAAERRRERSEREREQQRVQSEEAYEAPPRFIAQPEDYRRAANG